jgi:hypothetical protein
VFIGTYFGLRGMASINAEPELAVLPLGPGADRFTFAAHSLPPQFQPGALVYLKDGRRYAGTSLDFRIASHVSTIAAVEGATVIFANPTPLAIGGDAEKPPTVLTPSDALAIEPAWGVPSRTTKIARGVRILNGAFESAETEPGRSQTVHVACHDCDLDFRWLAGSNCIGINPCSDTTIAVRDAQFTNNLFELACFHARVHSSRIGGRRDLSSETRGLPAVSVGEYGHSVQIDHVEVIDAWTPEFVPRPSIGIFSPLTNMDDVTVRGSSWAAVAIGAKGSRAQGSRIGRLAIEGTARIGLYVDAGYIRVDEVTIDAATGSVEVPIRIGKTAGPRIDIRKLPPGVRIVDERQRAKN